MATGIYNDIATRTKGDIYIGVVGPVRTGKSTFIKKFMETAVIPKIDNRYKRERAIDELPQSGSGKSIMTCEPKFVPNEAVKIQLSPNAQVNVRLIDSVGYIIEGAAGITENGVIRKVTTPWSDEALDFNVAAEMGTKKVITEHSTIGIMMTTDASITDIPRENYVPAEEKVIAELKRIKKPFIIVVNSVDPYSEESISLSEKLRDKYSVAVIPLNVMKLTQSDIESLLSLVLYEFPVAKTAYRIPKWISSLKSDHWLLNQIDELIVSAHSAEDKIRDVVERLKLNVCDSFSVNTDNIDLARGELNINISVDTSVFYKIISEENEVNINGESDLFNLVAKLLKEKDKVELITKALTAMSISGYGIIIPDKSDFEMEVPSMINENGRYGILLKSKAYATHLIKTQVDAQISPMIGSETECSNFYEKILNLYENDPYKIWETEFFGRTVSEMMADSIVNKLSSINDDTKVRLSKAVSRISNTTKGGLFILWI